MRVFFSYFKESWQELNKVTWPSRAQTIRLTIAVVVMSTVLAAFMSVVDLGFAELVKKVIIK